MEFDLAEIIKLTIQIGFVCILIHYYIKGNTK